MGAASREIERMYSRGRLVMLLLLVSMLMSVAMGRNPGGNKKKRRNNNRSDKEYRNAFAKCEKNSTCTALVKEEVPRCALQCMSSSCYTQVYGDDQLEPGELDHHRRKLYKDCFRTLPQDKTAQNVSETKRR